MDKKSKLPPAPSHLRLATQQWWGQILQDYDLEPSDLRILEAGCVAWDRAEAARDFINSSEYGVMSKDRFGVFKENPACAVERDSTRVFLAALRQLGIGLEGPADEAIRLPDYTAPNKREGD